MQEEGESLDEEEQIMGFSYEVEDDEDVEDEEGREVEQLLSQDNELDLIFYNYTRLLEGLREQCLDYGYRSSSNDEEEEDEGRVSPD